MVDVRKPATLRGFNVSIIDVGDQMHLCHPLLSFEGDSLLYIAHKLDWQNHPEALAITDLDEASQLGTLFPETHGRLIASGEGVVAVGAGFAQAAAAAKVQFPGTEMPLARIDGSECLIGTATSAIYTELRTRLVDEARTVFDDEMGDAARHKRRLSERGNAALLLLRRCGPLRREDLAIRQLAGARQNREFDLYRRLLIRFELELEATQDDLHRKVERHIELAASAAAERGGEEIREQGIDRPGDQRNTLAVSARQERDMGAWPLQDARNRFSAVVNAAMAGTPQQVTRRGKPAVVVLAADEYERLRHLEKADASSFADSLLSIPQDGGTFERLPLSLRSADI